MHGIDFLIKLHSLYPGSSAFPHLSLAAERFWFSTITSSERRPQGGLNKEDDGRKSSTKYVLDLVTWLLFLNPFDVETSLGRNTELDQGETGTRISPATITSNYITKSAQFI